MTDGQTQLRFAPWIKRFPGDPGRSGATVIFPHAGGAAASYRPLALALSRNGVETFVVQYPQRADRLTHPAAATIEDLAAELFAAADWNQLGALRLFGHCMGAVVGFEFARIAERRGVNARDLWASAGQAAWTVAGSPPLPTTDRELIADMADLGGTDARLLEDEDFIEMLLPAVKADYQAFGRYACDRNVRIKADIHAIGGDSDHRVTESQLRSWEFHTSGVFTATLLDGGHFYIDDHIETVVELIND